MPAEIRCPKTAASQGRRHATTDFASSSRKSDQALMDNRTRTESGGVAAVDRALAILGAFRPGDMALPLCEISQRCNLYKSTVLRIAQSLLRRNYLQRLENGSYQIGPTPLILGALYQHSTKLGDVLLPLMRDLVDQTGESMSIYLRNGDVRVCLHRIDSTHAVRDDIREGDVLPLERGSGGRILLAFSGAKGEPYETIRTEYVYTSVGERDADTAGISVPFFGAGPVMGAMSLAGPRSRIDETFLANARVLLLRAAARATRSLGGDASALNQSLATTLAGKERSARITALQVPRGRGS
jgi:DNA-binding IclR family transcriptional regulator